MKRLVAIGLIAVAATFALGTPGAAAAKVQTQVVLQGAFFPSKATIIFYGFVDSPKKKCERGRKVDVFFDLKSPATDPHVGRAISQANGGWALYRSTSGLQKGFYYAKVKRARARGDVCKGDRSPSVLID